MINNEKCHPNDNCFWNVVLILNSLFSRPDFFFYISSDGDVDREILNAKLLNIFLPFDSTTLNVCHNTRPAGLIQENTIEQKITELPVVRKLETITLTACTQKGILCRNYRNMKNARLE